jgi:hypothetical protein
VICEADASLDQRHGGSAVEDVINGLIAEILAATRQVVDFERAMAN